VGDTGRPVIREIASGKLASQIHEALDSAEYHGIAVMITRWGRPSAVVISAARYAQLIAAEATVNAAREPVTDTEA
jgi:prevent-host-death family protein